MKSLISLLLLLLAVAVQAASITGSRLLVIADNVEDKHGYNQLLNELKQRRYDITFETPKSESLSLFHLGQRTYDHILILPTKVKGLGPNLAPNILLNFLATDGNILLALSSEHTVPTSVVTLLHELDLALPAERTGLVVDHFAYDTAATSADTHDVLLLPPPGPLRDGVNNYFSPQEPSGEEVIAFPSGIGHTLGSSPLLAPILRAPNTAYSYNPKENADSIDPEDLFAAGEQLALVSAVQARNSARFTVVGSAEMLSDGWFDAKVKSPGGKLVNTWNREFAKRVAAWTFQELGVLRVNSIEHRLNEAGASNETNPDIYRVKNNVTYTISLSEYSWDKSVAYHVPAGDDLQLEFSMLSPFQRLKLNPDHITEEACNYSVNFTVPDQHGIFNFKVNYKRPFLTNIDEKNTVSVRHMAHDEWPRSYAISGAWPWISGYGATVLGFLAFCAIWLFSKPTDMGSGSKKMR